MTLSRRVLCAAAGMAALDASRRPARAEAYPLRPISWVVPYAAGGSGDLMSRLLAAPMAQALGQPVVIDNRSGANGALGMSYGLRARPDGYTLTLAVNGPTVVLPQITNTGYDPRQDLVAICGISTSPTIVVVPAQLPIQDMRGFIAYAKAHPRTTNYASVGVGSLGHLGGALMNERLGLSMEHVAYRGYAPANTAMLAGEVQVMLSSLQDALPLVREGRLRALASTGRSRLSQMPELPTVAEAVGIEGFEAMAWNGVVAPIGTPREIVERLNREVVTALGNEAVRRRFADLGLDTNPGPPEAFAALIAREYAQWGDVARRLSLRAE